MAAFEQRRFSAFGQQLPPLREHFGFVLRQSIAGELGELVQIGCHHIGQRQQQAA